MKRLAMTLMCCSALLCCMPTLSFAQKGATPTVPLSSEDIPEWQARLELADLLSGTGRFKEAEEQYRKVLAVQPENNGARQGLARVLAWTGRGDEAEGMFSKLPNDRVTLEDRMLLVDLHIGQKEYDKAIQQLDVILAEHPDADDARLKLAQVYSWDGKLKKSIEQYERLLKRQPDDIQVRRKYAQVLSWAGRNEDAIRELKRTLE